MSEDINLRIRYKYTLVFTSVFLRTFEEATRIANMWSKGLLDDGTVAVWLPEYNTTIKVETEFPTEECWVITNRFDPDIRKANETTI